MVEVIPGIYDLDLVEVRRKVTLVAPYTKWIQLDFSDGSLVPKKSLVDIEELAKIISDFPEVSFEAHMMVAMPEKYIRGLSRAGFKRLIIHVEANDPRIFLDEAQYESFEVGIAIDGPTEIDQIEPYLESVDCCLVMTIEMGDSGKPFLPETLEKVRQIHESFPDLPIEVDGGINDQTSRVAREAGAMRLSVTNYIFKNHPNSVSGAMKQLSGE